APARARRLERRARVGGAPPRRDEDVNRGPARVGLGIAVEEGRPSSVLEEFLDAIEERLRARVVTLRVLLRDLLELAQQLFLPRRQMHGRFHRDVTVEIARRVAPHGLDALVAQAERLAGLRLRGD